VLFISSFLFFYLVLLILLQPFYRQLYFLLCISCFFRSSLTLISGDIKQKTEAKRQDVKNSKKQETGNKKHIVEQA